VANFSHAKAILLRLKVSSATYEMLHVQIPQFKRFCGDLVLDGKPGKPVNVKRIGGSVKRPKTTRCGSRILRVASTELEQCGSRNGNGD